MATGFPSWYSSSQESGLHCLSRLSFRLGSAAYTGYIRICCLRRPKAARFKWVWVNTYRYHFYWDEHPFTSYFDVHQGYKVLTHCHMMCFFFPIFNDVLMYPEGLFFHWGPAYNLKNSKYDWNGMFHWLQIITIPGKNGMELNGMIGDQSNDHQTVFLGMSMPILFWFPLHGRRVVVLISLANSRS